MSPRVMAERPIIFSAPMVRAILDGRKTQTRRVLKPQPTIHRSGDCSIHGHRGDVDYLMREIAPKFWGPCCVGDRLWVRETFSGPHRLGAMPPREWELENTFNVVRLWYWADGNPDSGDWTRPKPSIHMPRWVSRITLEVTGVRVERLQEISEKDAAAEGIEPYVPHPDGGSNAFTQDSCWYRANFEDLWGSINGKKPGDRWENNPWIAVIEFKRIKP